MIHKKQKERKRTIMSKVICSPGCYIQGNGELKKLADYCAKAGANKAYLLIDKFIYDTYKDNIESSFKVKCLRYTMEIFGGECSEKEIRKHQNAFRYCHRHRRREDIGYGKSNILLFQYPCDHCSNSRIYGCSL